MQLDKLKHIYFLGIGGIGMSALARYFSHLGVKVSGYDLVSSPLTKKLEDEGMDIHYEEDVSLIPKNADLFVYTPAIPDEHKELELIRKDNRPLYKRAEVLGMISNERKTIAIAGTHGKTTTSSILSHVLKETGNNPSAFLGGVLAEENSNYLQGDSDLVVLEADEYDRSFLHLTPFILVIVAMDADHLDIYGTVDEMYAAYEQLCTQVKDGGTIILGPGAIRRLSVKCLRSCERRKIRIYKIFRDFDFQNVRIDNERYVFDFESKQEDRTECKSNLPGLHNVINTTLALKVADVLEVKLVDAAKAVSGFKGIKRRFEWIHDGAKVLIDDYAHHPEEVRHIVNTVRELYPRKKILGIFQPHLYSRTKDFYKGFAKELSRLDAVVLLPVYPARELPVPGVTSELIYNLMSIDDKAIVEGEDLVKHLKERNEYEVYMTIGAADLDKYHKKLIELIK